MNKITSVSASAEKPVEQKTHPIRALRRAGVPLAAFETSDPAMTIKSCMAALGAKADTAPIMRWDSVRGLVGLNPKGSVAANTASEQPEALSNPVECLSRLLTCAAGKEAVKFTDAICFFLGAHRVINESAQAVWNLRDQWKSVGATLIMLAPTMRLPDELTHDVVVINEPLPNADEVGAIVDSIAKAIDRDLGLPAVMETLKDEAQRHKIVDTLLGMSAFAAEQVFAMSLTPSGVDKEELWNRKRKMVEQTPGLTVWKGKETFGDIGGLDNLKRYLTRILKSERNPVRAIAFLDEIEKMLAGAGGDMSGVAQDQLQVILTQMQDQNIPGLMLVGHPGCGKSVIAKAAGAIADAEVLSMDTGAMTGSLVGESQEKIRHAFKTFSAVSQGKGVLIATCNSIGSLPPELRRRFTLGTFFVGLPSDTERNAIWPVWLTKFGHALNSKRPDDDGWTGAEIRACCEVAYRASMTLVEASEFIVPVSKAAPERVESLCRMADGKFLSASEPGLYKYEKTSTTVSAGGRKFSRE